MNLEQALNDHLTALNPPQAEVARINQAQHALNTLLRAHFDPQGSIQLGGSWARGTAISPINDVDLLLVVAPSKIPSLLSLNPTELMGKVESELRGLLGGGLRRQNRSFGLTWQGVPFDLVLCTTETGDILRLPDLSRSRWLRTSPARHKQRCQDADRACNQRLLPLIRGVKAWRRTVGKPLKSFHLEAMLWETMTSPPRTWAEGLQLAFSRLAERAQRGFPDPTGLGAQVDDTLTMADRQRAVTLLRQAAERAAGLSQSADPARAVAGLLGARG